MRLLVVDDIRLAASLRRGLTLDGFAAGSGNGTAGVSAVGPHGPDPVCSLGQPSHGKSVSDIPSDPRQLCCPIS